MPRFGLDPITTGTDDVELLDIPTTTALGATAADTFRLNPTISLGRASQLEAETTGREQSAASRARFGTLPGATVVKSDVLTPSDAQSRIAAAGLTGRLTVPPGGIPTRALDLLIESKTAELRHGFILDRYRGGIAGGAAQLATSLAVSLADPINIGSAFVPVVGPARYAGMLERAGASMWARGGIRAGVGVVEGTVGAGLVEPLIYLSQQQLQADYDVSDSLMNIGFGGIFGGVLHPAAGGVMDIFAKRAGIGAWSETIGRNGQREVPDLPDGVLGGGGTRWVQGEDYVRGQFAVVEASKMDGLTAPHERLHGDREELLATAAKYGLDAADVASMAEPVLVRLEGNREVGGAKPLREQAETVQQRISPIQAAEFLDSTVAELRARASDGLLTPDDLKALGKEDAELEFLLRDHYAKKEQGILPADGLRDGEVGFAEKRRIEIRNAIEKSRAANNFGQQLKQVLGKLDKLPDSDAALVDLVERMKRGAITQDQAATALRMGVAQAVNGDTVNVAAVAHLDGTPEGVERFLRAKASAEAAEAAEVAAVEAAALKAIAAGIDVTDAAKLDADVKALETEIRAQMEAAGDDMAAFDAALKQADEEAAELKVETQALRGIEMCLMRSA